ncbi:hypothetical protein LWC34_26960 [Kibdelosporangium philippinense]|uniref:IrrE N-terminal-like domain-containing protein n=1 Tax=Kibdelosporangium philippinense TaxID=211113 RepID=A0ABS8ZF88_9PSEU|nr:hypothetical protein [Kibdelosporangium philippinense]MCE7006440.1 hypothetical protein [Kibdelosporangium philippinense]
MGKLRRQCEERLRGFSIPQPFDLVTFCAHVSELRGRRLELKPIPGLSASAPCGMWVSLADVDYVLYEPATSKLHSEHIILHELAHMLCDHRLSMDSSVLRKLLPSISPDVVRRVLGRVDYATEQEQEAEMLASLIRGGGTKQRSRDALSQMTEVFSPYS